MATAPAAVQATTSPPAATTTAPIPDARQVSDKADAYMQAAVRNDHFSGTVLIARNGAPIFVKSYGSANYELGAPNTNETVYALASVSKQFTALAIMQLKEQGKIKLSDPICRYLDDCPPSWRPITIQQLLSHTSGIPNYSSLPDWDEKLAMIDYTRPELVALFRDLPLQFTPGEKFKYSNSGYFLLGMAIERVSQKRFGEYLEERIFKPAGMMRSHFEESRTLVPGRATGYYSRGTDFINARLVSPSTDLGTSGIYSTVGDLLRWDNIFASDRLISRASREEMLTPVKGDYGYGWHIGERSGRLEQHHSGSDNGFSTYIIRFPSDRTTVIVLSNSDKVSAGRAGVDLSAIAFGAVYKLPSQQLTDMLWDVIAADGVPAALDRYRELKRTAPDRHDFSHEPLVDLGYDLIAARKLAEATAIFEFNLQQYPKSGYSYHGLADIALARNDPKTAVDLFETSLRIDPDNEYVVKALARLRSAGAAALKR
ncbi:MAG: serine hydrolase [Sphingomonas bacterium]|nr:serine hydrolase [Sphingomonas bacterium]